MAKLKISDYSSTSAGANLNTDINSIDIDEGCAPSGINNAIRTLMAQLKDFQTGVSGDSLTLGGALSGTSATFSGNVTASAISGASLTLSGNVTASAISGASMTLSGDLTVDTNTLYVDSANNEVGIGTSSPNTRLTVNTTGVNGLEIADTSGNASGRLFFTNNTSGQATVIRMDQGDMLFNTGATIGSSSGTERMRINSSGNVGIGTSSPDVLLQVSGNSGAQIKATNTTGGGAYMLFQNADSGSTNSDGLYVGLGAAEYGYVWNYENNILLFGTNDTERMRIDSSGNVGIGMTTPGAKLGVTASATGVKVIRALTYRGVSCENGAATGETTDGAFYSYTGNAASTAFNHYGAQCGGSVVFKVLGNGNVQNTNNSYGAISDVKLKENIVDTTPKLSQLNQVRVVNYNFIGDAQKQIGVVAQELESIFPSMVEEIPERDEEGNDIGTTAKSVKYSVFVPILIKAIQEQQETIKALEARIQTLENK